MAKADVLDEERLLRPGQVARIFSVTPKTISRWDESSVLPAQRTPGGHRRFRPAVVTELLLVLQEVGDR